MVPGNTGQNTNPMKRYSRFIKIRSDLIFGEARDFFKRILAPVRTCFLE
jgi:hypothetical protein